MIVSGLPTEPTTRKAKKLGSGSSNHFQTGGWNYRLTTVGDSTPDDIPPPTASAGSNTEEGIQESWKVIRNSTPKAWPALSLGFTVDRPRNS